jgi:hypothetical protein
MEGTALQVTKDPESRAQFGFWPFWDYPRNFRASTCRSTMANGGELFGGEFAYG